MDGDASRLPPQLHHPPSFPSSVYAPGAVSAGDAILVQVFAHLPSHVNAHEHRQCLERQQLRVIPMLREPTRTLHNRIGRGAAAGIPGSIRLDGYPKLLGEGSLRDLKEITAVPED